MTIPYTQPLGEEGLLVPYSPYALDLRASDLNVFSPLRGTPTFSRASEGLCRDSLGALYLAAHSQSRVEYFDLDGDGEYETAALCFDGARTNLCPRGASWGNATLTNATRTTGADALGEISLTKINDADGANQGYAQLPILTSRFGTNGNGVMLFQIAAPDVAAASGNRVFLWDTTAGTARAGASATWSGGVPSIAATHGTLLWVRLLGITASGRRVYEVAVKATGTLTTNDHAIRAVAANTASQTGDIYIGYAHVEDVATFPLPLVVNTGTGAASYVRDVWSLPFDAPPQAMSFYLDFIELGARYQTGVRVLSLGNATPGTPEVYLCVDATGAYEIIHHNGSSSVTAIAGTPPGVGSAVPNVGDRVRLFATLSSAGVVSIRQSINDSAFSTAVSSGALALATAWAGFSGSTNLYLGHNYANRQASRIIRARVALGTLTADILQGQ